MDVIEQAVAGTAGRTADYEFFLDFDGTLSAIVPDPQDAVPVPGARDALGRLAAAAARVTVVSGRPVEFLAGRLGGVPGLRLAGLYGLETSQDGGATVRTLPEAAPYEAVVREVVRSARATFPDLLIEDKRLSCAVHYRSAPDRAAEVDAWAAQEAQRHGLKRQPGRFVVELKPPLQTDKGTVVDGVGPDAAGAWFFGDDLGDLPAFAALDRLAGRRPGFRAVRVAVAGGAAEHARSDAPDGAGLADQADLVLPGPEAVPAVLNALTRADRETLQG